MSPPLRAGCFGVLQRRIAIEKAIAAKVGRHPSPLESLTIGYGSSKGKGWTLEEDRFLLVMLHQLGYGAWDSIRNEVRRAWQFRFDWFMKSRTSVGAYAELAGYVRWHLGGWLTCVL